jgi:DNA-binding transcriptional LysR family regulator
MLENFRSFARAVECGSFSEAGRHMRVSANVVSQRIQALETHLGCRLFNRTTRNMGLTEQGRIFYDHVIDALHAIDMAEANIGELGTMPLGSIRIAAPLGLGRRLVADTAAAYRDKHPKIDVQLRLSERRLDIIAESCDLALQYVTYADSSMIMRKIADAERVLCAAPAYIEQAGMPMTPTDLANHQCLLLRFPGSREFRWPLSQGGEEISVPIKGSLDADDGDVLTTWALDGRGIVLKPVFEIAQALAQGLLIPVLTANPPSPSTLAVLYPTRNLIPLKVKAFADLLVERGRRYLATELARLGPFHSSSPPLAEEET